MILIIDNFDSFTYNLFQQFLSIYQQKDLRVIRNNAMSVNQAIGLNPSALVISPGPGTPKDTGISRELMQWGANRIPILGVCLGHQLIGEFYGAEVIRANYPMHGKVSPIKHFNQGLFKGIDSPLSVARYHSLVVDAKLPAELRVDALSETGEIMALSHIKRPIFGVQFHPESFLTKNGDQIIKNFIEYIPKQNRFCCI